jgi:GT2 family glycosyltransferase
VLLTKAKYFKGAFENESGNKGMDENYHWAFDDVDLCLSIGVGQNKKVVYCGQTSIFHEESASLKKNPANKLFMRHNTTYFKNKWKGKYTNDQDVFTKNANHNLYKK